MSGWLRKFIEKCTCCSYHAPTPGGGRDMYIFFQCPNSNIVQGGLGSPWTWGMAGVKGPSINVHQFMLQGHTRALTGDHVCLLAKFTSTCYLKLCVEQKKSQIGKLGVITGWGSVEAPFCRAVSWLWSQRNCTMQKQPCYGKLFLKPVKLSCLLLVRVILLWLCLGPHRLCVCVCVYLWFPLSNWFWLLISS